MREFQIKYIANSNRGVLTVSVADDCRVEDLVHKLDCLLESRYKVSKHRRILMDDSTVISVENYGNVEVSALPNSTIYYTDIVPMDSAWCFDRIDSMEFIFHTSEKSHLSDPHIHAKTDGNEYICLDFNGSIREGNFRSKTKEGIARRYVKENRQELSQAWNLLMNDGIAVTMEELRRRKK